MRALSFVALLAFTACATSATSAARYRAQPLDPACLARVELDAPLPREVRRCEGEPVIAIGGERAATGDEVARFQGAHAMHWVTIDPRAHLSAGTGGCCPAEPGAPNEPCVRLSYNTCTLDEPALIARLERDLATSFPGDSPSAAPRVLVHIERARPVHPAPRNVDASWPAHTWNDHIAGFSGGACVDDSDCVEAGCGNHCVPWNEPRFIATCEGYEALDDAQCGCHDAQCTWLK